MGATRQRGRPAAATREDVIEAGLYRYLRGSRVDVQAIAAEIGVGRATVYRWFGSRDNLIGEVVIRATEPVLTEARAGLEGRGGPGLLDTFDRFNRALADAPALRVFVEQEHTSRQSSRRSSATRSSSSPRPSSSTTASRASAATSTVSARSRRRCSAFPPSRQRSC